LQDQHVQAGQVCRKLGDLQAALEHFIKGSDWSQVSKTLIMLGEGMEEAKKKYVIPALELAANLQNN